MTHVPSHQIHHRGRRAAALVAAAAGLAMTGGLAAVPAQAAPAAFSFGTPVGSSYVDTASTADNPACANVLLVGVRES
ncbi:MAG: hypothetical protein LBM66_06805, partial [Bifidobacteriaceae bacterium]|nr:hypothetical protein [Bifidobacteriaceae bacterium]